jgi:hypothetical protein
MRRMAMVFMLHLPPVQEQQRQCQQDARVNLTRSRA